MKAGDRVRCIHPAEENVPLVEGEVYIVRHMGPTSL